MRFVIVVTVAALHAAPSSLEEGVRLQHALTSAKARLRGLQRQEKKEEQKSNGTFWAFQAMNDTLHDILEPKLAKANNRTSVTELASTNASKTAAAIASATATVAGGLDEARRAATAEEKKVSELEEQIAAAERSRREAEEALHDESAKVSHLEQKLLFFEAQARGANDSAVKKAELARLTAAGARRLQVIAAIEKDRVEKGSTRALARADASLKLNLDAQAAAKEDVEILERRLHAWRKMVKTKAEEVARAKADRLQREADEAKKEADAIARSMSQAGKNLVAASPYESPSADWAWDGKVGEEDADLIVDDDDEPSS
jgi:hypothetical protein